MTNFSKIVIEKYHPEKIILFGSYARGDFTEDSDIDVAVIVASISGRKNMVTQYTK